MTLTFADRADDVFAKTTKFYEERLRLGNISLQLMILHTS